VTIRLHLCLRNENSPTNSAFLNECAKQNIRPPSKRIRARPKMPSSQTPESGLTRLVLGPFVDLASCVGGRSRGTGPAAADPVRGCGEEANRARNPYADEILLKLNMTIWNATIYCVLVVRDTVMVSLR
jgi:hypothetical protein